MDALNAGKPWPNGSSNESRPDSLDLSATCLLLAQKLDLLLEMHRELIEVAAALIEQNRQLIEFGEVADDGFDGEPMTYLDGTKVS